MASEDDPRDTSQALKDEVLQLKQELATCRLKVNELSKDLNPEQLDVVRLRVELTETEQELNTALKNLEEFAQRSESIEQAYGRDIAQLNEILAQIKTQAENIERERDECKKELNQKNERIDALTQQLKSSSASIESINTDWTTKMREQEERHHQQNRNVLAKLHEEKQAALTAQEQRLTRQHQAVRTAREQCLSDQYSETMQRITGALLRRLLVVLIVLVVAGLMGGVYLWLENDWFLYASLGLVGLSCAGAVWILVRYWSAPRPTGETGGNSLCS